MKSQRKILLVAFAVLLFMLKAQESNIVDQYIYVPQEDWKAVLKQQPKGVRLSYSKYLQLLHGQKKKSQKAPLPMVTNDVEYKARIEDRILFLQINIHFSSLSDSWKEYSFSLGSFGISHAELDGKKSMDLL